MKLFIASDIHGSAYYTELFLDRFIEGKMDSILLLGDILYHGPRNDLPREYDPKSVTAQLNKFKSKIYAVRGNCDAEVDDMVLDFNIMNEYIMFISDGISVCAMHGHHNPPLMNSGQVILCGHTHVPSLEKRDNFTYINPGSVSIPKEASPHSYMTFCDGIFKWYDVNTKECYTSFDPKNI